jgi:hypothetical protein
MHPFRWWRTVAKRALRPLIMTIVALGILSSGFAQSVQKRPPASATDVRLWGGQAYTSYGLNDASEVGPHLFHTPDFEFYCNAFRAQSVRRLRVTATPALRLRVGERFYLHKAEALKIVAFDEAGTVVERVPVSIEVEAARGVLDESSGGLADGALLALTRGRVRFVISTSCPGTPMSTSIATEVR